MLGTLDSESLRDFFSYNINTKLTSQETQLLIYYFNGLLHRFSNTISLSDLVKDMKLLALEMPSAILSPPSEDSYSSLSSALSSREKWYDHWCKYKVRDIELYFRTESQRILRINEHQNNSSGIGSHLNRLKKSKHQSHLLSRLKFPKDNGSDEESDGNDDDDVTVSTIGMESVNSPVVKLKPIGKRGIERNENHELKTQVSSSSTISSSSSVKLSPIKSSSSSTIQSSATTSQPPVVDIRGKVQSIHYNLASPYVFSTEAAKERNQLLKQSQQHSNSIPPEEVQIEDHSSISLSSKNGDKAFSFAIGAAIVMRAHHVKSKLAEENKEILSAELAMKSRQQQKQSQRSGHP